MLPIALTVAGSDSGGGAGIQADLKTFQAFGVFGTSAVTALTAQNTLGVRSVHTAPPEILRAQIRAVVEDLPPAACKSGMLATVDLVETTATAIAEAEVANYVLDPVMVATSGDRLLDREAEASIAERLVPLAAVVTPNLAEAAILAGIAPERLQGQEGETGMREAAEALVARGAGAALIKGGHRDGAEIVDVLFDGREHHSWRRPRIDTTSTHGTGCTLSSGIAAGLAHGRPLLQATEDALDYVARAMTDAPGLGAGHGPLNHLVEAGRVAAG